MAQFQGFCRDLHDDAVDVHIGQVGVPQKTIVRNLLTQNRKLDTGNPRKSALGADFGRFGFNFVDDLNSSGPLTVVRLNRLEHLVEYRNAIGHGDESKVTALEASSEIASTKKWYRTYRSGLNALAGTMDGVVSSKLSALLGIPTPW